MRMAPVELQHPAEAQQPAPAKQKVHEPKPVKTKFAELLSADLLKVHVDSGCASMTPALCQVSFLDACDLPGHGRESNPSRGGAPTAAGKKVRRKGESSKGQRTLRQRQGLSLRLSFRFDIGLHGGDGGCAAGVLKDDLLMSGSEEEMSSGDMDAQAADSLDAASDEGSMSSGSEGDEDNLDALVSGLDARSGGSDAEEGQRQAVRNSTHEASRHLLIQIKSAACAGHVDQVSDGSAHIEEFFLPSTFCFKAKQ